MDLQHPTGVQKGSSGNNVPQDSLEAICNSAFLLNDEPDLSLTPPPTLTTPIHSSLLAEENAVKLDPPKRRPAPTPTGKMKSHKSDLSVSSVASATSSVKSETGRSPSNPVVRGVTKMFSRQHRSVSSQVSNTNTSPPMH